MKTKIFICTHAKDFPWLKYCLFSLKKFVRGFAGITILVPDHDLSTLQTLVDKTGIETNVPVYCLGGNEWPGQGMLWHEYQIMCADHSCPGMDFIAHFDPDCIFTEPVTPETFIKDGKPILQFEPFASIGARCPGVLRWQEATNNCLPFHVADECMRGHPEVYHRALYQEARNLMLLKTGQTAGNYVQTCRNEFPQTFCEYCTLGAVAKNLFPEKYVLVNNAAKPNPDRSDFPVIQFWSHGAIDQPQDIWIFGEQKKVVPLDIIRSYGLV